MHIGHTVGNKTVRRLAAAFEIVEDCGGAKQPETDERGGVGAVSMKTLHGAGGEKLDCHSSLAGRGFQAREKRV